MPIIIHVHQAKTHFSRSLDQAHEGQEIILAKASEPGARLVPPEAVVGQRQAGRLAGQLSDSFFDPLPAEDLDAWARR